MNANGRRWQPVLEADRRDVAVRSIRDIETAVSKLLHDKAEAATIPRIFRNAYNLMNGIPGEMLLQSYAPPLSGEMDIQALARRFANTAARALAQTALGPSLFHGLAGIAWTLQHLLWRAGVQAPEDLFDEVDDALLHWVSNEPNSYDLLTGVVGAGVYALERIPSSSARRMLDAIAEYLLQTATWTPVGVAWYTPSERGYHLGVAHGLPGVIALLAQLRPFDMASGIVDRILEPAVHYLLSTARKSGKGPRFPSSLELAWPMPRSPVRPGLAWCWGDLGIAATLALAGRVVREDTWMNEAVRIALRAARMSIPASDVLDMALCHGAAGIALIFNRFFQTTGNEVFQDASQRWYNRLLNSRRPEFRGGYATLLPSDGPHGKVWAVNPGFLSGLAGIGLSLCAACTETAPSWDRLMLLSSVHDDGTGLTWRAPTP